MNEADRATIAAARDEMLIRTMTRAMRWTRGRWPWRWLGARKLARCVEAGVADHLVAEVRRRRAAADVFMEQSSLDSEVMLAVRESVSASMLGLAAGYPVDQPEEAPTVPVVSEAVEPVSEAPEATTTTPFVFDLEVDPAPDGHGYLYVIQFATGVIKVGQTTDPQRRFGEHKRNALAYGVEIVDFWLSPAHADFLATELDLINLCSRRGTRVKREYFVGLDFHFAKCLAEQAARRGPIGWVQR